jgi:Ca-activated chloride channel family protein
MDSSMMEARTMKAITMAFLAALASALFAAPELTLSVEMERPVLPAGPRQLAYLKVGLAGFEWEKSGSRPGLNVALVLDRSGSMEGDKLERAKDAAKQAVSFLTQKDILSIVTYETEVRVLLPATRVSDKDRIMRAIDQIYSDGSTALFAGVSKGAAELRKFLDRDRVNRVILLSDGLANVGPDRPGDLADLGASLRREGISVTTIGLGLDYNEDLMTRLAQASDGNHAFVREPADLARIFDLEFRDAFAVVAQDVRIRVRCAPGVRPLRVLNRESEIRGQEIDLDLNNVYSSQDRYFLIEVEVPAMSAGQRIPVAEVSASYLNMATSKTSSLSGSARALASASQKEVLSNRNADVTEKVALQKSVMASEEAVNLRDKGRVEEAKKLLESNAADLDSLGNELNSPALRAASAQSGMDAGAMEDEAQWGEQRKAMRDDQYSTKNQQRY